MDKQQSESSTNDPAATTPNLGSQFAYFTGELSGEDPNVAEMCGHCETVHPFGLCPEDKWSDKDS